MRPTSSAIRARSASRAGASSRPISTSHKPRCAKRREEVGIEPRCVEVTGYLQPLPTVTGYAVTPVVGLVNADVCLVLDEREVASAFEVPLDFLLEPANRERTDAPVSRRRHARRNLPLPAAAHLGRDGRDDCRSS
ncbi:MAG: hypothetical protein U5K76_04370 [Woeseiaceae bacterium]|nr:hypothetical protein [Woeseiaceae bacterium]